METTDSNRQTNGQYQLAKYDRRITQRGLLLAQVEIGNTGNFSIGRVQNISEGGMLVLTHTTIDLKTEIMTRFNLRIYPERALYCE